MTPYELMNLQRGIGDLEGIIRQQRLHPTTFSPIENWVINHLKIKKQTEMWEQARQQEKELQKEIEIVAYDIVKEINNQLKS